MADSTKKTRPVDTTQQVTALDKLVVIKAPEASELATMPPSDVNYGSRLLGALSEIYDEIGSGNGSTLQTAIQNKTVSAWSTATRAAILSDLQHHDVTGSPLDAGSSLQNDIGQLSSAITTWDERSKQTSVDLAQLRSTIPTIIQNLRADPVTTKEQKAIDALSLLLNKIKSIEENVKTDQDVINRAKLAASKYEHKNI